MIGVGPFGFGPRRVAPFGACLFRGRCPAPIICIPSGDPGTSFFAASQLRKRTPRGSNAASKRSLNWLTSSLVSVRVRLWKSTRNKRA